MFNKKTMKIISTIIIVVLIIAMVLPIMVSAF